MTVAQLCEHTKKKKKTHHTELCTLNEWTAKLCELCLNQAVLKITVIFNNNICDAHCKNKQYKNISSEEKRISPSTYASLLRENHC